jgi:hypothetical protein
MDHKPDFVASFDDSLDDSEPVMEPIHVNRERNILERAFQPKVEPKVEAEAKPKVEPEAKPKVEPEAYDEKPEANPETKSTHLTNTVKLAETIEIQNPKNIFPHIMPYPEFSPKQHHFRFKHRMHATKLEAAIREIDPALMVQFNEGKDNVDVILERNGSVIGKMQFLHFDRRDRYNKPRHYVKIHFYQFEDSSLFHQVIQAVKHFFESMGPHSSSRSTVKKHALRKKHQTMKKKKHALRKKPYTRKKPHRQ